MKLSLPNRRISSEALTASFRIRDRYWSCLLYRKSGVTLCLATSPTLHRLLINNNSSRDQIKSGVTWCLETSTAPAYRKSGVTLSLATSTVLHHPPNFKSRGAWQNYWTWTIEPLNYWTIDKSLSSSKPQTEIDSGQRLKTSHTSCFLDFKKHRKFLASA